jgi:outer membrane protein assembly factor BamB
LAKTVGDWVDSSPAIGADGTIYFGSWDNNIYAFAPDGTEKWRVPTNAQVISSAAIAADGTVYIGSGDNLLYALSPDGQTKWTFPPGVDLRGSGHRCRWHDLRRRDRIGIFTR